MSSILVVGMNHETAPVELRECLVSDPSSEERVLAWIRNDPGIREGVFVSTCNRVEVVATAEDPGQARDSLCSLFTSLGTGLRDEVAPALYLLKDREAIAHVFRVASSLDSMVVGEPQILGQIKQAYSKAVSEKLTGAILNRLMHRAFHVAKRVRTETGVCDAAVSISSAAVELAKKIFHSLEGRTALLIGAGDMAELAVRHLIGQGVSSIIVANRTLERAMALAHAFHGRAVSLDEVSDQLPQVDIVISSTASPGYLITRDVVKSRLRKRRSRPLFFIDIAVPRDVEPSVNDLDNVYLYDVDDLKGVAHQNLGQRRQEAVKAQRIVEEEVLKFEKWLKTLAIVPTVMALQEKAEALVEGEIRKSSGALSRLRPEELEAIRVLTRSVAEKLLNDPILFLKRRSDHSNIETYLDLTRKLFNLDKE